MPKLNRRQTLGLMGAAATATLATPAIAMNKKIVVGALRLTSHSGSFVALHNGYFKDAGLDAELRFFQAAQPVAVAIASGDVDYGVTAITGGLINLAEKGAVKVVGGALREEAGIQGMQIMASKAAHEAGLTSPDKLDGKRYGVTQSGSSFHYVGSRVAAQFGGTPRFVPLQKVGAIIGALKSGQIDAWNIVPHIAKGLIGSGAAPLIGNVVDYLPNYQITTVFTSAKNADNERAMTEDFLAAFGGGVRDYNATMVDKENGDDAINEMVDIIHQHVYTDRPREKAAPSIIAGSMRLSPDSELNLGSVRDQMQWMQSEDLINSSVTLDTFVDTSYVKTMDT